MGRLTEVFGAAAALAAGLESPGHAAKPVTVETPSEGMRIASGVPVQGESDYKWVELHLYEENGREIAAVTAKNGMGDGFRSYYAKRLKFRVAYPQDGRLVVFALDENAEPVGITQRDVKLVPDDEPQATRPA